MASSARIDELRKKFDENPRRYFAPLANEYRKSGDLEQAIFICQEYLPQQPGHMSGHIVYGQALYELSRFDEAKAVFETALSLDPENLIALRHLGDIARHAGELKTARAWYQRVLEADPRNEEIAQVMMTLLATPEGGQPAISQTAPTPLSTPAISAEPIREPQASPSSTPSFGTFFVEKSQDRSELAVGPELGSLPEREVPEEPPPIPISAPTPTATPTPSWGEARLPSGPDDLLDLEDFTLGGVSLGSLGAAATPEPPKPTEPTEPTASTEPTEPAGVGAEAQDTGFDLGHEEGTFEDDPYAIAASPEATRSEETLEIELAADMRLGLPDDSRTPGVAGAGEQPLPGLESYGDAIVGAGAESQALETESFFDLTPVPAPAAEVTSESAMAPTPPEPSTKWLDEVDRIEIETSSEMPAAALPSFETPAAQMPVLEVETASTELPAMETPATALPAMEVRAMETAAAESEPVVEETMGAGAPEAAAEAQPAEVAQEPEAFLTETMAELYLQQGHLEAALDIYRALHDQRPDDAQLAERLRAIEAALRSESARASHPAASSAESAAPAGPTIREFLMRLLRLRPSEPVAGGNAAIEGGATAYGHDVEYGQAFTEPVEDPGDVAETHREDMYVAETSVEETYAEQTYGEETYAEQSYAEQTYVEESYTPSEAAAPEPAPSVEMGDAVAPPPAPPAPAMPPAMPPAARGTPSSSDTVSGSIDALFTGAEASASDTDAATTLAQAFAPETPEVAPLQGMPAHAASSELSLDHVFKTGQPKRPEPDADGFSFDQFFAEELGETAPRPGTESPAPQGGKGTDDIAQFNKWLNGLKKT